MTGPILAFIIIIPFAFVIAIYRLLNNGREPCINTNVDSINKIVVENN
jgi:hypothetical protein